MKQLFFLVTICIISIISCKKTTPSTPPEILLKGGTWQLTKLKRGNDAWKDSIGINYKFVDDTTVITNRYNPTCNGKYEARLSTGLKTIDITFWPCKPSANHTFSIESIEGNNLTLFYNDEIAGQILQFKEQYVRQ